MPNNIFCTILSTFQIQAPAKKENDAMLVAYHVVHKLGVHLFLAVGTPPCRGCVIEELITIKLEPWQLLFSLIFLIKKRNEIIREIDSFQQRRKHEDMKVVYIYEPSYNH